MQHAFLTSALLAMLAALPLAAQPREAAPDKARPKLVIILAHPDDELVFAPAIHHMANGEFAVTMVFATRGDQGPGVSGMERGAQLAELRMAEAACASEALDVRNVVSLDLGDGKLGIEARKADSAANRLFGAMPDLVVGAHTVITFGPEGGYGHSDHRMTGAVVTQYLQSLGPRARPRLLYPAIVHDPLPDQLVQQGWSLTAPDLATVRIAYDEADLAAAENAAQCYKSQFDPATRAMIAPGFDQFVWRGEVSFRPAF